MTTEVVTYIGFIVKTFAPVVTECTAILLLEAMGHSSTASLEVHRSLFIFYCNKEQVMRLRLHFQSEQCTGRTLRLVC